MVGDNGTEGVGKRPILGQAQAGLAVRQAEYLLFGGHEGRPLVLGLAIEERKGRRHMLVEYHFADIVQQAAGVSQSRFHQVGHRGHLFSDGGGSNRVMKQAALAQWIARLAAVIQVADSGGDHQLEKEIAAQVHQGVVQGFDAAFAGENGRIADF